MDAQRVDAFLMANGKYFPEDKMMIIRDTLLQLDESKTSIITTMQFKDPIISIVLSLFAGGLGIDRFYIGDTGLGVAKLLTCGGFGIWAIVDLFLIMGATRNNNLEKLQRYCF